jgi:hypothetical protein
VGLLVVVVVSAGAGLLLPTNSLARACWCVSQVVAGLLLLVLAQVSAIAFLGPQRQLMGMFEVLVPGRILVLAVRKLPQTRWPVSLAAWGVALSVLSLVCVNGLSYWLPASKKVKRALAPMASLGDDDGGSLEDLAGDSFKPGEGDPNREQKPENEEWTPMRCVIIGYTFDGDKLGTLLVAEVVKNEIFFAGEVSLEGDALSPEGRAELLRKLVRLYRAKPVFKDLKIRAEWVKPSLLCDVEYAGLDKKHLFKQARLKSLLDKEVPTKRRPPPDDKDKAP